MSKTSRFKSRKFLYQILYASAFSTVDEKSFKESFFSGIFKETELDEDYFKNMFDLIHKNEKFLIFVVKKYAPKFDIRTMDLSFIIPIFISVGEIFFLDEEIPVKVSINEAIQISKIYGDDSSRKTVNGILNKVLNNIDELKKNAENFDENFIKDTIFKKNKV